MRQRVIAKADEAPALVRDERKRVSLSTVSQSSGALAATELWVGMHLSTGTETLQRLATRVQRFTPRVSLVPPDGLLLEVKGSLHLFAGVTGLRRELMEECLSLRVRPVLAFAPTPLAALTAARAGLTLVITDLAQLVG